MAWAIFLAFILYPLHRWLTRKFAAIGRAMSAGIITGLTPFALLTPLTLLGVAFANQARALVDYLRRPEPASGRQHPAASSSSTR